MNYADLSLEQLWDLWVRLEDEQAFNEFYLRHKPSMLMSLLRELSGFPNLVSQSEDIVDESLHALYRMAPKPQCLRHVDSSSRCVVSNRATTLIREAIRRRERPIDGDGRDQGGAACDITGESRDILTELCDHEALTRLQQLVQRCLRELPDQRREILLHHNLHRLTYREIGERTGLTYNQVLYELSEARNHIRRHYDELRDRSDGSS